MRLTGRVDARGELRQAEVAAMRALMIAHFDGIDDAGFAADLAAKSHVVRLVDEDGVLRGFTTLEMFEAEHRGKPVQGVFSGDTIVAREAWGSTTLPRAWIGAVASLTALRPTVPAYWMLICSGFRTYHFLPLFFKHYSPSVSHPTPPEVRALADTLATARFGERYDAERGVVTFARPAVLRAGLGDITDEKRADQHVAFFETRNPGHARGDELVCLAALRADNLTAAGRRMIDPQHPLVTP